jgi:hypothetical protein
MARIRANEVSLKERLLAILLCQGASSETDSEFYTMETHNDSETLEFDSDDTIAMDILGTKRGSIDKINDETASQRKNLKREKRITVSMNLKTQYWTAG